MRVLCQDLGDAAGAARHDLQVQRSSLERLQASYQTLLLPFATSGAQSYTAVGWEKGCLAQSS